MTMSTIPTPKKGKGGNPTKYKPEYCEMLIEHMSTGLSYETFGTVAKCCRDTLYEWEKHHPEWKKAKKEAFNQCQVFWEKAGLEGMFMGGKDNPFNSAVWIFNMKNRFMWRDRTEQKVDATVTTLENLIDSSIDKDE